MASAKAAAGKGPKIRPIGERILVKRLDAEEKTKGGIYLPDNAKEKPTQGKIVALGDGKLLKDGTRAKFQISVGDKVVFNSYAGTDIKVGTEEYLLMSESDVLAILD
ncbi:MAG TPA: co-chaperone GroES [Phycisphaerales bacterium]|nr:co-chaperone GroES [Phycisphaerales bacterium]